MCGAHCDMQCPMAVGAPAKQDWSSLVVQTMASHPKTATSPLVLDPGVPLCPSIAENHGVDERSMRGVFPGSRADTKLGICHGTSPIL